MVNTLWRGDDACHMDVLWRTLCQESLIAKLHASARSEHRVGNDQHFLVYARCGKVFNMYAHLGMCIVCIFPVSRHESVAGMVEDVQEALVEWQTCTEDGSEQNLVLRYVYNSCTQRCRNLLTDVFQRF